MTLAPKKAPIKAIVKSQETTRTVGQGSRMAVLLGIGAVLLLGVLGGRLAQLQIVDGKRNKQLAENNRVRIIPKPPERGRLVDRYGKIVATSRLAHAIYLWPIAQPKEKWPAVIAKLSQVMGMSESEILRRLEQEGYTSPNLVRLSSAVSPKVVTFLAENASEFPGVQVDPEAVRYYPNGDIAAHLLGYTGELTEEELQQLKDKGYRPGDTIGKAGVESAFETLLRGEWGGQQVEVDATGRVLRVLGQKPPKAGKAVRLTIDLELQKAAEAILGNLQGGIVAMNPQNGEVLAMASHPNFDPNVFSTRITEATWARLQAQDHPFVNRVLQAYPPASTYKIITTTAALESGKFSPNDYLDTFPYLNVGGIQFWDHNNAGFGTIGFPQAMAYSSDTFFYQIGRRLGPEPIIEWTRKYGFGERTGIELADEEAKGLVPDPEWKQKVLNEPWYVGNTINMSIGQGDLQANLLHVALMTAVVANNGYLVRPHLALDDADAKNWRKSLNLTPSTLDVLRKGLHDVFVYGTGAGLRSQVVEIAGKSGTAEDPPRPSHTWFTAYAPFERPEIVVVVFGENSGGGGSSTAGPRAVKLIETYMQLQKQRRDVAGN